MPSTAEIVSPNSMSLTVDHDGLRFARSAEVIESAWGGVPEVIDWMAQRRAAQDFSVEVIAFDDLDQWGFDDDTGNLRHRSGRFFSIEGLRVFSQIGPVHEWTQPIINQAENGLLGLLTKEFDGVLHFLMQAKMEPGNPLVIELSPTVQATRSNFTRVHNGSSIKYFEHFAGPARGRVITDALQSEQGDSFYRKRNRNMVVEVTGEVDAAEDFRWMTLGQIHILLAMDSMVNMDTRTVLSTLPLLRQDSRSLDGPPRRREAGPLTSLDQLMSWHTGLKCHYEMHAERIPLEQCDRWNRTDRSIAHETGDFFSVIGVSVRAASREVSGWTQPMLTPAAQGLAAFVIRRINGVMHILVHGKAQPGLFDFFEFAPTVQCVNADYRRRSPAQSPAHLDLVLSAPAEQVRFSTVLSEEGGRFHHRENLYRIIEVGSEFPVDQGKKFRWVTVDQLALLAHLPNTVNVEARTLLTCLQTLA